METPWPMTSPRTAWLIYALCSLVVLATMGWLLRESLEADELRFQAEQGALREQDIRLALWRMDTKLASLIAQETARPHYVYQSFLPQDATAPPNVPSVNMAPNAPADPFEQRQSSSPQQAARENQNPTPKPSPLLQQSEHVILNFEVSPSGQWQSPQVPTPGMEPLANRNGLSDNKLRFNRRMLDLISNKIDPLQLIAELPRDTNQRLPEDSQARQLSNQSSYGNYIAAENPFEKENFDLVAKYRSGGEYGGWYGAAENNTEELANANVQVALPQTKGGKGADLAQRGGRYQQLAQQEFAKQRRDFASENQTPASLTNVVESISRPLWIQNELLLARRIVRDNKIYVQGSWLEFRTLRDDLLSEVKDLFPDGQLVPLMNPSEGDPSRMLAGLPVEFRVPHLKNIYIPSPGVIRNLAISAGAVLAALVSVGALLWGVLALSERRAAFVSSVTHELRTPLTTCRMYSEMLAGGMVPQAERRQEYLETLRVESERLSHLVENVLSYARLERGRGPTLDDSTTPGELIERLEKRLADRAKLADMELVVEIDPEIEKSNLLTDLGVVEQILFNLVDNAAKYASSGEDRRIHLLAKAAATKPAATKLGRREIAFQVRDHGPGYESERKATRSAAFSKSAQKAAESVPGVGLGLALCRRLAKQLGGKLEVSNHAAGGAEATLVLPLSPKP